jgi:hypothetical protein
MPQDGLSAPIIEQAKKLAGEDADDLAVLQFLMQASIAGNTARMRLMEESKIPVEIKPVTFTVTDQMYCFDIKGNPWISFDLINNGPGGVTVWINNTIPLGESNAVPYSAGNPGRLTLNMIYPLIKKVKLQAQPGTTASVLIYAKVGKYYDPAIFGRS